MIARWLEGRRKARALKLYESGYSYAVISMLRGTETETSLMVQADNQFDRNEFERGMSEGLRDLAQYVSREILDHAGYEKVACA